MSNIQLQIDTDNSNPTPYRFKCNYGLSQMFPTKQQMLRNIAFIGWDIEDEKLHLVDFGQSRHYQYKPTHIS